MSNRAIEDVAPSGYAVERAGAMLAEPGEPEEPHRKIMEILTVSIRRLADADASRPSEHPLDLRHQALGFIEPSLVAQGAEQRDVKDDAEGVGPEIAQPVRAKSVPRAST